jgi:hypothetical protein
MYSNHLSNTLLLVTATLCVVPASFGFTKNGTTYTTDGSLADVLAATTDSALHDGDTVKVPAGSFTWGTGFTGVNLSKAITLRGAGQGQTIITLDPTGPNITYGAIQIFSSNATVADMTINGSSANNVNPFVITGSPSTLTNFRITRVTYNGAANGPSSAYFAFITNAYGLIDNCTINGGAGNAELIFSRGPTDAWQTPDSPGTANAIYVEDCTFGGAGYICDFNANSRGVVRYCTITANMKIDGHGMDSNSPARSVREIEAYGNTWTNGGAETFDIRGGTGFLFDNKVTNTNAASAWFILDSYGVISPWPNYGATNISTSTGNPTIITTGIPHGYATGYTVFVHVGNSTPAIDGFYTVTVLNANQFTIPVNVTSAGVASGSNYTTRERTPSDYPLYDQVGRGQDAAGVYSGVLDPVYLWNNTAQGADWTLTWKAVDPNAIAVYRVQTNNNSATFTMQDIILSDRDYFKQTVGGTFTGASGMGVGVKADIMTGGAHATATKTGVGYWVTDEASWNKKLAPNTSGQLYVWNGSAWVLKYTPFAYPHPLRVPNGPSNARLQ